MANGITDEIKYGIIDVLIRKGRATWAEVVNSVAREVDVHPMYVERVMGTLVQTKVVDRHDSRGFPTYSVLSGPQTAPPGKIDGKYADYNQKRLDIIKGSDPSVRVDNTYGDNSPWHSDIKGPKAV